MSKYEPLITYLQALNAEAVHLSFSDIEEIIEDLLPESAYLYRAWWANSRSSNTHTWANQWMNAGWVTREINLDEHYVVFSKLEQGRKFWWVNHKRSHKFEIKGGYIWAPQKEINGRRSEFYLNLTRVKPGDIVFSYANKKIMAFGLVSDIFVDAEKPIENGEPENSWNKDGWLVPIIWTILETPFSPKDHIEKIREHLKEKYSPINSIGEGNMKCYLANITEGLASTLLELAKTYNQYIEASLIDIGTTIEDESEVSKILSSKIDVTEKEQLIRARLGQGVFRQNLLRIEKNCRVTGLFDTSLLIASHIKPWRASNNIERLDGENGLLLSPHIDKLFDRGWISFSDDGDMIVYDDAIKNVLHAWHIKPDVNIKALSKNQKRYLKYHREEIFRSKKNLV